MMLNIRRLLQEDRGPVDGEGTFDFTGWDFKDFTVKGPVHLTYTATPEGGSVKLVFVLTATVAANCGRCLTEVEQTESIPKEYRITEDDLTEEFPELPIGQNGCLDMQEFAYQELVLETPPVLLCSEDCEGLCPQCGKAAATCGCEPVKEVDPRLQGLLELLQE